MLIIGIGEILQFKLAALVTTDQLPFVCSFKDVGGTGLKSSKGISRSTTEVEVIKNNNSFPQEVQYFSIKNSDTVATTVIIQNNLPSTTTNTITELVRVVLAVGDMLQYNIGDGWKVIDNAGAIKITGISGGSTSITIGTTPILSGTVSRILFEGVGNVVDESANLTFTSATLTLGVAGSATGRLALTGSTSGTVTLNTAAAAGTWTLTLPTTDGNSGEFLQTDGSGITSWVAGNSGTVTSVSGTASRITSTGGATPVIDISAVYVGQTSITVLGTVTTGTLSTGAVISGVTMTLGSDATGDIYYRNAGGVLTRLAIGSNTNILTVSGGLPSWSAAPTAGANTALSNLASVAINTTLLPGSNDGAALGSGTFAFSDLFLASGALINFANGNSVITHSSGILTVSTGDLRVTTAGTNAASVATLDGTQTITNKSIVATQLTGTAYTFGANNTNATAAYTLNRFEDHDLADYAGTFTWNSTPPATIVSQKYAWSRIGNTVTLFISVLYTTTGTTNTNCIITMPSDCPNPAVFADSGDAASEYMYPINGARVEANQTANPSAIRGGIRRNSGDTAFEILLIFGSTSALQAQVTVMYRTS